MVLPYVILAGRVDLVAGVTREALAAGDRLPDRVGIGLLTRVFPPGLVDEVIDETGAREQRYRALPARLMVYFTLALWLFMRCGYGLVLEKLTAGLTWAGLSEQDWEVPRTGSITKARHRLGPLVMARLFRRTAGPLTTADTSDATSGVTRGAWWRGLRVCSLDASTLDVPDTAFNDAVFGRPTNGSAPGPFPQVRIIALAENGTKALIDAAIEGYCVDERTLARQILPALRPDMLVLADRGFPGYHLWADAAATGAHLVWRIPASFGLPVLQTLPEGTYLSHLTARRQKDTPTPPPIPVRVIEYTITTTDTSDNTTTSELFCLITTLVDPATAPAMGLAQLYHQRWQIETALGAMKTDQRGPGIVLRSHQPAGVLQELWAMFCVYHAIRELAFHAATHHTLEPTHISFKHALETARDSTVRDFSPSPQQTIMEPRTPHPHPTPQPPPTPTRP
jgi:transposase IS4-like protein/DDE family transposase